jgi:signal peptidase II
VGGVEAGIDHEASWRPTAILIGTAVLILVADQVTKALVAANLGHREVVPVLGDVVRLWHVRNTGAAFSLLPGATWIFIPVTIVALGMVAWFHRSLRARRPWIHVVLGAVLGGTLGNLVDRVRLGYVVDWIDVGLGTLRWPTFNVADPAVVLGILTLVVYLTFVEGDRAAGESSRRDATAADEPAP